MSVAGLLGSSRAPFVGQPRSDGELRAAFRKPLGVYMMGTALFVALWFVANPFFNVHNVWDVANYLMAGALVAALVFNAGRNLKNRESERGERDLPRRAEVKLCLYLTAGVALLFFRNWFLEIAGTGDDDSTTGLIWIVVNVLFPLTAGATGLALWRDLAGR